MVKVINNQKKWTPEKNFIPKLEKFLEKILEGEKFKKDVTVILLDNVEMKKLNQKFLGRDEPTDVLAFPLGEENEVYVSVEIAKDEEEIVLFALHGLLHLLGYDHYVGNEEKVMRKKEKQYLLLWKKY